LTFLLWSLSGAAALVYWALSQHPGVSLLRSLVKGLALAPVVVFALLSGAPLIALALALCSLGDVCLSRAGERAFLAGLSAFALGHLGWIAVFAVGFPLDFAGLFSGLKGLALAVMFGLALFMARLLLPHAGGLRLPVAIYLCIILAMGLVALATPSWGVIAGALLFMVSDSVLGAQTFVLSPGTRLERLANALIWPLYWGAIVVLTLNCLA